MRAIRLGRLQPLWLLATVVFLVAAVVAIVLATRSSGADHGRALALYGLHHREGAEKQGETEAGSRKGAEEGEVAGRGREREEGERDVREAAAEIDGEKGGEGERHGARTPWAEQVANRAYPRNYVDDRIARRVHRAFERVPARAPRSAFRSQNQFENAIAAAPDHWTELGPVTPNVAGEASQFFDPVTQEGPATQESGRLTAVAVDPACAPGDCRTWVTAAGGGVWRTNDALADKPSWEPRSDDLPTTAFGSIYYDAPHGTLYAGSGEPNGSGDSEAGLGLFKSTDDGDSWTLVPGSAAAATNRSIGSIAVAPGDGNTIYIGVDLARHGSSSVNGGRRTPPNAPPLGLYKSTDGGTTFARLEDLSAKTPANPTDPAAGTGADWFQGGVNRVEIDPNDPTKIYAAVFGYGLWRSDNSGATWSQIYHTFNQTNFDDEENPGDTTGDRTEFDLVDLGATTRAFLGDGSDDLGESRAFRNDAAGAIVGSPTGAYDNAGWIELSSEDEGSNGFAAFNFCQGQCGYDMFVVSPPGKPDEVWLGGSMNYDELPAYAGSPPRSNGRAVIRSTDASGPDADAVEWQDMTLEQASDDAWDPEAGLHPDQHGVAFSSDGGTAFVASDGGLARVDVAAPEDHSASCDQRRYVYEEEGDPEPLNADDLSLCQMLLAAIPSDVKPLNDGLRTIQFQSLSFKPGDPGGELMGGTQDNGTWSFKGSPAWFESVGGDGGQSGFNAANPTVRFHNYFDATPEVNFHGDDPKSWLNIYDPLQESAEARSFYTPFITDPKVAGRLFTGLEHVWRAENNGGNEADLTPQCLSQALDLERSPCGNWEPIGENLATAFGASRSGQFVVATERAPSDTGTLWAATRTGRVLVSGNADAAAGAVRFQRLDDDDADTPPRFVSGIAVDATNPNHAIVSYSGYDAYTPAKPGHVFDVKYDPAKRTSEWTDLTFDLGDQPVTDVVRTQNGDVYASTDFGVLRLANGATGWQQAAADMPKTPVFGLTLDDCGGYVYAATHGRGAFALTVPKGTGGACAAQPEPTATPSPTATATPTPAPTPDKTKPKLTLSKVKAVRRPKRSTLKGRATDAGGISRVVIRWGDGKRTTRRKLSPTGRFTARHRYRKAKLWKIRVTATDKAGNSRTKTIRARVRKRRS
jgi:hypothetical protein